MEGIMDDSTLRDVITTDGTRIWYDSSDRRGEALARARGDVNPSSTRLWRAAVELAQFDCIVDVGANYGEMLASIDLSKAQTVLAYEPNERLLPALRRTLGALAADVRLRPVAVGRVPDTSVNFAPNTSWSGKSRVVTDGTASSVTVRSTTLDSEVARTPTSLAVKIDVEGAELDVIGGMHRLMNEADLVVIMLEILHMSVQQVSELTKVWPTYVLVERSGDLVRLPTNAPLETGMILHEGTVHRENAVLIAGREAAAFIAARQELQRTAAPIDTAAPDLRATIRRKDREIARLRASLDRRSVKLATQVTDSLSGWMRRGRSHDR
ncbi:FkbM family methyltransferase [Curtobacterium sp. SP.BCp]|uniref:FkbM family methyltransferase n=1 Tax=Curtobacterium sp. SP.BCp TaxID=3435230 RepID=UPI003F7358BC